MLYKRTVCEYSIALCQALANYPTLKMNKDKYSVERRRFFKL